MSYQIQKCVWNTLICKAYILIDTQYVTWKYKFISVIQIHLDSMFSPVSLFLSRSILGAQEMTSSVFVIAWDAELWHIVSLWDLQEE